MWGTPLLLVQESTYTIRKCAVEVQDRRNYPEDTTLFSTETRDIHEDSSGFIFSTAVTYASTCSSTSCSIQATSNIGEKAVDRLTRRDRVWNTVYKSFRPPFHLSRKIPEKGQREKGRKPSFTCTKCHFKGHRVTACHQLSCPGYFECGNSTQHKDHREEVRTEDFTHM